jgi:hypothetical protein
MTRPDYRVRVSIYDGRTEQVLVQESYPLKGAHPTSNEVPHMFSRAFDAFEEARLKHEATHYPKDDKEDGAP